MFAGAVSCLFDPQMQLEGMTVTGAEGSPGTSGPQQVAWQSAGTYTGHIQWH